MSWLKNLKATKSQFQVSLPFKFFKIYFWLLRVFVTAHELSLVVESGGYSLVGVHRLLIAMSSLVAEHRLSCPWAYGIFLVQGSILMSPALAGRFFLTPGPPGKSPNWSPFSYHCMLASWSNVSDTVLLTARINHSHCPPASTPTPVPFHISNLLGVFCVILKDFVKNRKSPQASGGWSKDPWCKKN